MSEKRTLEERVLEKEEQLKKALEKANHYKAKLKQLQNRKASEERKQRTHKLIVCGAEIASLFGHVLEKDEIHILVAFLSRKKCGQFLTIEDLKQEDENKKDQEVNLFDGEFDF